MVPDVCANSLTAGRHAMHSHMSVSLNAAQPKGGELKAIGRARREGVEVDGHSKLMTFGAFELHAKSALRRATGNMYTLGGRILQASTSAFRPPAGACLGVTPWCPGNVMCQAHLPRDLSGRHATCDASRR
jgi:hypothetical protein